MKKKKLFAAVAMSLAILMSVSLSGCGKDSSSEDDAKESTSVVSEISDESSDVESEPETEKPKKEESSKKEQSSKKQESKKESSKEEKADSDTVTPSFKETMDEYEEFMDKYVDFMKSYDANDVTMLSEYTELLSQYNTYMDKVSKIDEDSLSSADLAYYLDVTNRVNKKLLEVQQ